MAAFETVPVHNKQAQPGMCGRIRRIQGDRGAKGGERFRYLVHRSRPEMGVPSFHSSAISAVGSSAEFRSITGTVNLYADRETVSIYGVLS
jgi:hypothetical protein